MSDPREVHFGPIFRFLLLASWLAMCACSIPGTKATQSERQAQLLRSNAERVFQAGLLWKPNPAVWDDQASRLAPLIIGESASNKWTAAAQPPLFGALTPRGVDTDWPTVYFHESRAMLHGHEHPQVLFVWCHPVGPPGSERWDWKGIRMTLNSEGAPVCWESLAGGTRERPVFVARSLEESAAREFGPPSGGRQYSIERQPPKGSRLTVVRVLEDGPVPMGPIVYLEAGTGNVSTVLCRCMPAQVVQVETGRNYDLLPIANLLDLLWSNQEMAASLKGAIAVDRDGLDSELRLPSSF